MLTLAVASLGAGMASGRYERRAARQGIAASSQSFETAARLSRFGQVTGAVGNVIGIIDAFSMLAEAEKAERQGELSQFTDSKYLLVGVNVVGAVVGLIFSSALVVPLLISLFAIWIAGQIIHYVPLGIRVWVRRSIFGVPGRQEAPFASLEEEQESLEMVIRGISVDIDVIQRWGTLDQTGARGAAAQIEGRNRGVEPYAVSLKVGHPRLDHNSIYIEVIQRDNVAPRRIASFSIATDIEATSDSQMSEADRGVSTVKSSDQSTSRSAALVNGILENSFEKELEGAPEIVVVRVQLRSKNDVSVATDEFLINVL